jgi:single-strand DNA-binding protein
MSTIRNSVTLIGHLGRDPEVRNFESGKSKASFSLATNETYRTAKGDAVTTTQWHNCIAWGKTAERMQENLKKGKEVLVKGKLTYNNYEDKNGVKRINPEVVIEEFFVMN